jgi:hypothetical protein
LTRDIAGGFKVILVDVGLRNGALASVNFNWIKETSELELHKYRGK